MISQKEIDNLNRVKKLSKDEIKEIEIDLNGICNLSCPLCTRNLPEASHMIKNHERPLEDIVAQINEYPNLEICCLAGVISEPTLYSQFFELIEFLIKKDIKVVIYSNASIQNKHWWAKLGTILTSCDLVYFTICGTTQELHEKYRVNSSLKKILENHEAFKSTCKHPIDVFQYLRFEYNKEDYESDELKEMMKKFSIIENYDTLQVNERFEIFKDSSNEIKLTSDLASKYATISKFAKKRYEDHQAGKISCKMRCKSLEEKFISIDQFGKVSPCSLYRIFNKNEKFDLDYEKINKFKYEFCHECESMTAQLLAQSKFERLAQ